jgi:hypothetical protein
VYYAIGASCDENGLMVGYMIVDDEIEDIELDEGKGFTIYSCEHCRDGV